MNKDKEIFDLIAAEDYRQKHVLRMIASESIPSEGVMYAESSCFTKII